jgi:hypothetical protein
MNTRPFVCRHDHELPAAVISYREADLDVTVKTSKARLASAGAALANLPALLTGKAAQPEQGTAQGIPDELHTHAMNVAAAAYAATFVDIKRAAEAQGANENGAATLAREAAEKAGDEAYEATVREGQRIAPGEPPAPPKPAKKQSKKPGKKAR